jgi:hypothetical protein
LNDTYLPGKNSDRPPGSSNLILTHNCAVGALVLAHSLRNNGTNKRLAVLVTEDTVSAEVISELRVGIVSGALEYDAGV